MFKEKVQYAIKCVKYVLRYESYPPLPANAPISDERCTSRAGIFNNGYDNIGFDYIIKAGEYLGNR